MIRTRILPLFLLMTGAILAAAGCRESVEEGAREVPVSRVRTERGDREIPARNVETKPARAIATH